MAGNPDFSWSHAVHHGPAHAVSALQSRGLPGVVRHDAGAVLGEAAQQTLHPVLLPPGLQPELVLKHRQ